MSIAEMVRKAFLEGYATGDIQISTILFCILCTSVIASYIYVVYRSINRNAFYNRTFNLSLIAMAVITAAVILTIQSNIVVSLGMVGALSIVRFRTAIKDPLDLVFLFWSISVGIICGAGFAMIAVAASIAMTVIVSFFSFSSEAKGALLLVVNADSYKAEKEIMKVTEQFCQYARTRARNVTKTSLNLAVEVKVKDAGELIDALMGLEDVTSASLVEHDGNITA